jgi:hypothetical protein
MVNETLDICYRLHAVLKDVLESTEHSFEPDSYSTTPSHDIAVLIATSERLQSTCSVVLENSDVTSFTNVDKLENQLRICKMIVEHLDGSRREIYRKQTPHSIPMHPSKKY